MSTGILNMDGKLAKLTIMAFKDEKRMIPIPGDEFRVMFNPKDYTKKYNLCYDKKDTLAKTKTKLIFKKSQPQDYSFNFLIDGTGGTGEKVDVSQKIKEFLSVVHNYGPEKNKPKPLRLFWGDEISKCILTSAEVSYTLFKPDGKPLRATIKATFKEDADEEFIKRISSKISSNMDRARKIKDGDQLATIVQSAYGKIDVISTVAQFNQLDNFRQLPKGINLRLPSLNKNK
ncbi:MAG: hypothetical protein ACI8ZM_000499 [Crocinitomix sp.]|jgi:hypothetical protein